MAIWAKWICIGVGAVVLTTLLAFCAYDLAEYEPRRDEIRQFIVAADPENRAVPPLVRSLLLTSLGGVTSVESSRLLIVTLYADRNPIRQSEAHIRGLLWWVLVAIHLSEDARMIIIASLAPTAPDRHGLAATSWEIFGKPMSEFSLQEAAEFVALTVQPTLSGHPDRLAEQARRLILKHGSAK